MGVAPLELPYGNESRRLANIHLVSQRMGPFGCRPKLVTSQIAGDECDDGGSWSNALYSKLPSTVLELLQGVWRRVGAARSEATWTNERFERS